MKKENKFYLIFLSTIVAIRLWVFFFPLWKIIMNGIIIHHFWIGLIILLIAFVIQKKYTSVVEIIFPVSCGIITDELVYILFRGNTVSQYWSGYSIYGCIVISIIVFIFRRKIVKYLY
jgi:hypothetical protein